uniref:Protein FAR1-RELATED SEQUENCE n=1 Tax=Lactuca sativa TaxID=4236 RepID=A0A9R1X1G9_LACSA|nr:hypothetical protein LSAT_V11C700381810 [Lactuca sativa]
MTFSIVLAFMHSEKTSNYMWVLTCLKLKINDSFCPCVIVTDRDLALIKILHQRESYKLGEGRKALEEQEGAVDPRLRRHLRSIGGNKLLIGLPLHLDLFLCVSFGHYWHGLGELDEQLDELVEDCLGLGESVLGLGESDRETLNPFELRLESLGELEGQRFRGLSSSSQRFISRAQQFSSGLRSDAVSPGLRSDAVSSGLRSDAVSSGLWSDAGDKVPVSSGLRSDAARSRLRSDAVGKAQYVLYMYYMVCGRLGELTKLRAYGFQFWFQSQNMAIKESFTRSIIIRKPKFKDEIFNSLRYHDSEHALDKILEELHWLKRFVQTSENCGS